MVENEAGADDGLRALAVRLCAGAGRGRPTAIAPLSGGRNNQVFRLDMDDSAPVALKRYFSDPRDGRDRLAAEWEFIALAWENGVRAVPQPLARDTGAQAALYAFVPGRKLAASDLTAAHVDAAAAFVCAVNARPDPTQRSASEACFSIADHLASVERRLGRLATLDPQAPRVADAARFIATDLLPAWDAVKTSLERDARALGLDRHRRLPDAACCLSPSDFGFHNALAANDGALTFLDFEYAGRDDPAKLVVDFFCQPEIPVPLVYFDRFVAGFSEGLRCEADTAPRCRLLLDACRIKWICIILNDFLPVGAARRSFADNGAWEQRCAAQLAKAKAKLGEILASNPSQTRGA